MAIKVENGAMVHPKAQLGEGVTVGRGAVIGEHVTIGSGTTIAPGAVIEGWTSIGASCRISPYVVIGGDPQDLKFGGERSRVVIGDRNILREFVTIHRATGEDRETIIGHDNYLMVGAHVAHNCRVGDRVIITNQTALAGHASVESQAVLGGFITVNQYLRVGRMAMVGTRSKVVQDVPPFALADGHPTRVVGLNAVGLKRNQVSVESRRALKAAYRVYFGSSLLHEEALKRMALEGSGCPEVAHLVSFLSSPSHRGVYRDRMADDE